MRARPAVLLRVAIFLVLGYVTLRVLAMVLYPLFGILIASVLGAFAGAAIANALALRIYEQLKLTEIGLNWSAASWRNLLIGFSGGVGAASLIIGIPLLAGAAEWHRATDASTGLGPFLFLTLTLLFGAVGEEMLFRGYGFQILIPAFGEAATLLPMAVLFAAAHMDNTNVSPLALFNTFAWGVVLGGALLRSGDLWLPIGIHFGWNWALPLLGVNVSGFTMKLTGIELRWKIADVWSGGDYGPEGGLLCTIVLAALAAFLIKAPVRQQTLALTLPKGDSKREVA